MTYPDVPQGGNGQRPVTFSQQQLAAHNQAAAERELANLRYENKELKKTIAELAEIANGDEYPDAATLVGKEIARRGAAREADRKLDRMEENRPQPLAVIKTGTWLNQQRFAPLRWAVPAVVPEGLSVISGSPKAGKSFLMLAWALALATGRDPSGFGAMPARPVLYFALEDGDRRLKQRCEALGFPVIPDVAHFVTESEPLQTVMTAREWLDHYPDGVIIVDTLAKVRGPRRQGEQPYDHDYRTMGGFHTLAKRHPGSAVLVVHHTKKEQTSHFLDSTSGTYGISGAVDTVLVLKRQRSEASGVLHVTGRDVDEDEYRLSGFPFWKLDGGSPQAAALAARQDADREHLGDRSRELLDQINTRGQITTAEAAQILGVTSAAASAYLGRMAQAGKICRSARGVYTSLVSPVVIVGSVVSGSGEDNNTTHTAGDTRGRAYVREADDGRRVYDWDALWAMGAPYMRRAA